MKLNNFLRSTKESETLLINQISILRAKNNKKVYKFGFGQSPFPVPLEISQALSNAAHRKEYMSVQGHKPLRKAIASFHNELENKNFHHDRIIIGAGSKILIFSIMAAFEKAEVLLPAPSWVSYQPQAQLTGHKANWIETTFANKWSLTAEALDDYCCNRKNRNIPLILVLNYPNNPSGQTFNAKQLKTLAEVMKKHNILVIADEIYSMLKYVNKQESIANYYPEATIVSSGISKWCGAGGWRLGFIHIPHQLGEKLFKAVISVASETYSCAPSPIQIAATTAYENKQQAVDFLKKQKQLLLRVNEYCYRTLKGHNVLVHPCTGGFYIFPDFCNYRSQLEQKNIHTSKQLTSAIMDETGVALLPGSAFGMHETSLTSRLAFVDFDGSEILEASSDKASFNRVKKGIDVLCRWLSQL